MNEFLVLRLVETIHPPIKGLWFYVKPGTNLENVDAAVHHWSMQRWAKIADSLYEEGR